MKVLLIHHGDYGWGGGQIAMNRLQFGLRKAGVDAKILCGNKTQDESIAIPPLSVWESVAGKITQRLGLNDIHRLNSFKIRRMEPYLSADVLDFHCIHSGFFNYLALPGLTESKPAVFTLHDVWPFTGGCGISRDCERWKRGCGNCPYPSMRCGAPHLGRDATHVEWYLKNWVYTRSKFTIVAPSNWLVAEAKQSMLNRFPIYHIPHGIDTDIYQPHDPEYCRSLLGIPRGKKVLLMGVTNFDLYMKGGDLLKKALQRLPESLKTETVLLLLGKGGEMIAKTVSISSLSLGYVGSHTKSQPYLHAS